MSVIFPKKIILGKLIVAVENNGFSFFRNFEGKVAK